MSAHLLVTLLLAFPPSTAAVPLDVQLPAFLKALSFERNLPLADGNLRIAVVFDPADFDSLSAKDQLIAIHRELTRLRVKGQTVVLVPIPYESETALLSSGARVILVASLPLHAVESLARQSAVSDLLTFSTEAGDVERGLAVGMEMVGGRPRFIVNRKAAAEAGASFESGFLDLCRIVER
ncbi:MAG: YfiR family protein [Vicinamibacteria bacterium]